MYVITTCLVDATASDFEAFSISDMTDNVIVHECVLFVGKCIQTNFFILFAARCYA